MSFFNYFDLGKQCDACGNIVGGGVRWCPKCKICLCFQCIHYLMITQVLKDLNDTKPHCPMCGGDLEPPKNRQSYKIN